MRMREFFRVGLLAEMEMRGEGVFEEVNQQVSDKNKERRALGMSGGDFRLCGTISTNAVASMKPEPSAMKYLR